MESLGRACWLSRRRRRCRISFCTSPKRGYVFKIEENVSERQKGTRSPALRYDAPSTGRLIKEPQKCITSGMAVPSVFASRNKRDGQLRTANVSTAFGTFTGIDRPSRHGTRLADSAHEPQDHSCLSKTQARTGRSRCRSHVIQKFGKKSKSFRRIRNASILEA